MCLGLLGALLGRGERRAAREVLGVFALAALALGGLDWASWGHPFQSAVVYLRFNLLEGGGRAWGASDASYYLRVLWRAMPAVTAVLAVGAALAVRRAPGLCALVAAFLALHSLVPHKELRFILPVLPVWRRPGRAGDGSARTWVTARRPRGRLGGGARAGCRRHLGGRLPPPYLRGPRRLREPLKPEASAYEDFADVNRLLLTAGALPDLCGLKVEACTSPGPGATRTFTGTRRLYSHLGPPRSAGAYNYVLSVPQVVPPGSVRARAGPYVLAQLFSGPCAKDAAFSWRLP